MKVLLDLKCKYPSIEIAFKTKSVIIRYWGGLKFDKVTTHNGA
jgi:hypothetical protein